MALQAFRDSETRGRQTAIHQTDPFERDAWVAAEHAVIGRMADTRQVFPRVGSYVSVDTRFSHTISVKGVGWAIAHGLGLNESLTEAISICHDPAHCPYSHLGETILSQHLTEISYGPYDHAEAAYHLLQEVGGLNLSYEVLEGVRRHSFFSGVMGVDVPAENRVVAIADMFAYAIGDANDAIFMLTSGLYRGNMLVNRSEVGAIRLELKRLQQSLGRTNEERIRRLVSATIQESLQAGEVRFKENCEARVFQNLMDFLGREIYSRTDLPEDIDRLHRVLGGLIASDIEWNPYHVFALLTDLELEHLDRVVQITPDILQKLPVSDLSLLRRDDFSFLKPDLSWAKP